MYVYKMDYIYNIYYILYFFIIKYFLENWKVINIVYNIVVIIIINISFLKQNDKKSNFPKRMEKIGKHWNNTFQVSFKGINQ
jgi:hypothetical protein